MPLATSITRGGETLKLKWSYYPLSCMFTAACIEAIPDFQITEQYTFGELPYVEYENETYRTRVDFELVPIYYLDWDVPLLLEGRQTLEEEHRFIHEKEGPLILLPGDELYARRESK